MKDSASDDKSLYANLYGQEILVVVGFVPLEDKRPTEDISYMTSVREKVSSKIFDTLKSIELFDDMHSPAKPEDYLVITGEIRRFGWESFDTMISYIPGLNVLPFFGLPSNRVDSEAEIYLVLKNTRSGEVILDFSELSKKRKKYNIYNFKQERAEEDLAQCFDIVLNKIRRRISLNKGKILEMVKSIAVEATKAEAKAAAKAEPKVEVKETPKEEPEEKLEEVEETPETEAEEAIEVITEEKPREETQKPAVVEVKEAPKEELKEESKHVPQVKTEEVEEVIETQHKEEVVGQIEE